MKLLIHNLLPTSTHYHHQYLYIKIFVVCPSVGVAVTNLRVMCKIITCVSAFTEMAIIFLEIVKAAAGLDTLS